MKLDLEWTDGEGFAVEIDEEVTDENLADEIIEAITADPGIGWTRVEESTPGVNKKRRRQVRERLFDAKRIVNIGREGGADMWLYECPERKQSRLYRVDDPTIQHLRPDPGADGAQTAPASPVGHRKASAPCAPPYRGAGGVGADPPAVIPGQTTVWDMLGELDPDAPPEAHPDDAWTPE